MLNLFRKSIAVIAVAAVAMMSMVAAPAMAAEDPGYGPNSALAPNGGWRSLASGESRWYTFHYDYNQITDVATEAVVELEQRNEDAVSFEVWTPRTVQHWINGDDRDSWNPVGAGAKLGEQTGEESDDNTLVWASNGTVSETYYVIVTNERNVASYYDLNISGEDVSFAKTVQSAEDEGAMVEAPQVATAATVMEAEPAVVGGYGPFTALAIGEDAGVLAPGESRWYSFEYDYASGEDGDGPDTVTVLVQGNTEDALSFEIWNPQTVQHWIHEDDTDDWNPVGAGSRLSNDLPFDNNEQDSLSNPYDNTLIWVGSSSASDTYYVIVTNDSNQAHSYEYSITGSTISF